MEKQRAHLERVTEEEGRKKLRCARAEKRKRDNSKIRSEACKEK